MKYLPFCPLIFFFSCGTGNRDTAANSPKAELKVHETGIGGPAAGTVITTDSIKISDPLNKRHFSVIILATEYSFRGTYAIKATYGPHDAETQITLPKSGKLVIPVLRRGDDSATFIVGFIYGDNPEFYDYYQIRLKKGERKGEMEMKYLKAYQLP